MTRTWREWEGRVVGGFPLLTFLGSSESSAVFLTERGEERAVIKLRPASGEAAKTQLANWERASQLSHPHLVRLFEHGSAEGEDGSLVFVVMEYAEEVLSHVDRALTSGEALDALAPALNVLSYLHGKGFAHGRLKPSNILAIADRLKLSGDAPLRIGERHEHSAMPQPYDAPELEQAGVSKAGDVWSLGIALVQMLTESLPAWEGNGPRLPEALPASFRDVARKCLRQDPRERASVAELAEWLQSGGKPRPLVKRRYVLPVVAGIAVVIGAALAIPYFTHSDATPAASTAVRSEPPQQQTAPAAPAPQVARATPQETRAPEPKPPQKTPAPVAEKSPEKSPAPSPVATKPSSEPPPAGVVQQMLPDVPMKARNTIHGKVPIVVRVQADSSGAVTSATVESGKSSPYFAEMSLKAARQWKFAPGEARSWILKFEYLHNAEHPVSVDAAPVP